MARRQANLIVLYTNKIVEHPGITQAALIRHALHKYPEANEKQVKKTILNMVHSSKKIRSEGERGNLTYHLNAGMSAPVEKTKPIHKAAASKRIAGKVVTGAEAAVLRGDPPAERSQEAHRPAVKHETEPVFELLLSDENYLHINLDGFTLRLNPQQVARLDAFLGRVLTDSARGHEPLH